MGSPDKARQVAEITNARGPIQALNDAFIANFRTLATGAPADELDEVVNVVRGIFSEHDDRSFEIMVGSFVRNFSDEELTAMIDFYNSDVGKSILNKQRKVLEDSFNEVNLYQQLVVYPQIRQTAEDMIREFEKKRAQEESEQASEEEVPLED